MNKKNIFSLFLFIVISCQTDRYNHITYLNKVNDIDSIYRLEKDTLTAIKQYQALFKRYPPHNSELVDEYQTYITLSDKYHQDFGGKESLYKLIPLVAPNWKYNKMDKSFFALYKKYGIDSLEIEDKVKEWEKGLNRKLVDSFSTAFLRNRKFRTPKYIENFQVAEDKKNMKLLLWTFDNYGFPSLQKIGLWGNSDTFMPMGNLLNHMATREQYPYLKEKLLMYVKSGDCTPDDYAGMIDKYCLMTGVPEYGTFSNVKIIDSIKVNRNRKKIGMPSLKHAKKIYDDYFKK